MRLFVSIDLPEELAPAVEAIQDDFRDASGLDLTDPSQAHVTLKFLGEVDEDRLAVLEDAIVAAVDDAAVEPFEATYAGLGAFPDEDYIRVVWLGVAAGAAEMVALHDALERRTTAIGFDPAEHEFTPHVTLARMEHAGGKELVQRALESEPVAGTARVEAIRLTESVLRPDGPAYSTVASFEL